MSERERERERMSLFLCDRVEPLCCSGRQKMENPLKWGNWDLLTTSVSFLHSSSSSSASSPSFFSSSSSFPYFSSSSSSYFSSSASSPSSFSSFSSSSSSMNTPLLLLLHDITPLLLFRGNCPVAQATSCSDSEGQGYAQVCQTGPGSLRASAWPVPGHPQAKHCSVQQLRAAGGVRRGRPLLRPFHLSFISLFRHFRDVLVSALRCIPHYEVSISHY